MTGLGRDYWKLWGASGVSSIGDGVHFAALPLLAATRSSAGRSAGSDARHLAHVHYRRLYA